MLIILVGYSPPSLSTTTMEVNDGEVFKNLANASYDRSLIVLTVSGAWKADFHILENPQDGLRYQ